MELNDILKVGEICEVSGRVVKAGVYSEKIRNILITMEQLLKI